MAGKMLGFFAGGIAVGWLAARIYSNRFRFREATTRLTIPETKIEEETERPPRRPEPEPELEKLSIWSEAVIRMYWYPGIHNRYLNPIHHRFTYNNRLVDVEMWTDGYTFEPDHTKHFWIWSLKIDYQHLYDVRDIQNTIRLIRKHCPL